ncbi:M4 family metallopeptidase [Actinomadura parmotrematis]|uniref:M4 family metallopeptidase n=1 Tax=Actinomadura parmotrematis TaxID=2864039 RepID=A0ABS7FR39_9ACTN|nr:M4 family metallopeptidase [Actinomadura parmotrematis]MBW8482870.1 M4 family metallopeptidase [Actinomadura parmotrematis]
MSRRRIAMASGALLLTAGAVAVPGTAATAAPAAPAPKPGTAGPGAFSKAPFTVDPPPATRKKAIDNAKKALSAHARQAHTVSGHAFTARSVVVDANGAADVRFDRTYKGLPVYGGDLIVHLKPNGAYEALNTAAPATPAVSTTPKVAAKAAAATARSQVKGTVTATGKPALAVWNSGRSSQLVWETVVRGTLEDGTPTVLHVLVDTHKGTVVSTRDEVHSMLSPAQAAKAAQAAGAPAKALTAGTGNSIYSGTVSIDLTQSGSTWTMKDPSHGNGYTTNLNHATSGTGTTFSNTTGTFGNGTNSDPASAGVDAHYGAAKTFDYFKNVHGRNGIFGNGAGVPSRTHYGNAYVNAFWDGSQMTYGDGSGNARPLVELDVAGHEMSHGVSGALTGWDETGETGGMNEGTSDIFGTMVEFYANNASDTPDYTMGELININGDNTPLRYMYQPSLDGASPNCYTSGNGSLDPHYSMGPLNHWFYLLAQGSGNHGYGNSPTCNSSTVTGLGNDKAAKIWYKALASYASSSENYARARTDSLKAAADLYGTHCTEYNTVDAAWAAVSVTGTDPVPGTCSTNPGSPSVTSPGNQTGTVGTAVSLQISASDPSGGALTYSATGLPAGLTINASTGLISGTPTTAGTSTVVVTAKNAANATGSATFTWTINPAGGGGTCSSPGNKVTNGGFESGTTPWTTTSGVVSANGSGETARTGTHFAWLNGYGSAHTDSATQSVTIPAGCKASLSFYLHIDTDESGSTVYDKLTVKAGSTTLATYSNANAATGYALKTFDVSALAGQTVTLSFSGTEDAYLQTSFVLDDVSLTAS